MEIELAVSIEVKQEVYRELRAVAGINNVFRRFFSNNNSLDHTKGDSRLFDRNRRVNTEVKHYNCSGFGNNGILERTVSSYGNSAFAVIVCSSLDIKDFGNKLSIYERENVCIVVKVELEAPKSNVISVKANGYCNERCIGDSGAGNDSVINICKETDTFEDRKNLSVLFTAYNTVVCIKTGLVICGSYVARKLIAMLAKLTVIDVVYVLIAAVAAHFKDVTVIDTSCIKISDLKTVVSLFDLFAAICAYAIFGSAQARIPNGLAVSVVMACRTNIKLTLKNDSAGAADLTVGSAGLSTGGLGSLNDHFGVAPCVGIAMNILITASFALNMNITEVQAINGSLIDSDEIVTEGCENIFASRALCAFSAGRLSDIVTEFFDLFGFNKSAASAPELSGVTVFCAGGFLLREFFVASICTGINMTISGIIHYNKNTLAAIKTLICVKTANNASGISKFLLRVYIDIRVNFLSFLKRAVLFSCIPCNHFKNFYIGPFVATAAFTIVVADRGARGSDSLNFAIIMSESGLFLDLSQIPTIGASIYPNFTGSASLIADFTTLMIIFMAGCGYNNYRQEHVAVLAIVVLVTILSTGRGVKAEELQIRLVMVIRVETTFNINNDRVFLQVNRFLVDSYINSNILSYTVNFIDLNKSERLIFVVFAIAIFSGAVCKRVCVLRAGRGNRNGYVIASECVNILVLRHVATTAIPVIRTLICTSRSGINFVFAIFIRGMTLGGNRIILRKYTAIIAGYDSVTPLCASGVDKLLDNVVMLFELKLVLLGCVATRALYNVISFIGAGRVLVLYNSAVLEIMAESFPNKLIFGYKLTINPVSAANFTCIMSIHAVFGASRINRIDIFKVALMLTKDSNILGCTAHDAGVTRKTVFGICGFSYDFGSFGPQVAFVVCLKNLGHAATLTGLDLLAAIFRLNILTLVPIMSESRDLNLFAAHSADLFARFGAGGRCFFKYMLTCRSYKIICKKSFADRALIKGVAPFTTAGIDFVCGKCIRASLESMLIVYARAGVLALFVMNMIIGRNSKHCRVTYDHDQSQNESEYS